MTSPSSLADFETRQEDFLNRLIATLSKLPPSKAMMDVDLLVMEARERRVFGDPRDEEEGDRYQWAIEEATYGNSGGGI